jgi:HPt (histidine-containing phosphotransfer) domain-containing protein
MWPKGVCLGVHKVSTATTSVLNIEELLRRVDDDRELLTELFFIFKTIFPTHLQHLREAVACKAAKQIESESHTLKGMLLNLSASRAAAVAHNLEQMGRDQQFDGIQAALDGFETEVQALLTQMDEYVIEFQP